MREAGTGNMDIWNRLDVCLVLRLYLGQGPGGLMLVLRFGEGRKEGGSCYLRRFLSCLD